MSYKTNFFFHLEKKNPRWLLFCGQSCTKFELLRTESRCGLISRHAQDTNLLIRRCASRALVRSTRLSLNGKYGSTNTMRTRFSPRRESADSEALFAGKGFTKPRLFPFCQIFGFCRAGVRGNAQYKFKYCAPFSFPLWFSLPRGSTLGIRLTVPYER